MKQTKKQAIIKSYLENEGWTSSYDFIAGEHNTSVSYVKKVIDEFEKAQTEEPVPNKIVTKETISIIHPSSGEIVSVDKSDYITRKTADLKEFGYSSLTKEEVLESVNRRLQGKHIESVIDGFVFRDFPNIENTPESQLSMVVKNIYNTDSLNVTRTESEITIKIGKGFTINAVQTFSLLKEITNIFPEYPNVGKCITNVDNFNLTLIK